MKKALKIVGIGILMITIYHLVLFVLSMLLGFESVEPAGIAPVNMLIAAVLMIVLMALFVRGFLKLAKPVDVKEAYTYSISWAIITFAVIMLITIGNQTTGFFFGKWYNYLPFVAMGIEPLADKYLSKVKKTR